MAVDVLLKINKEKNSLTVLKVGQVELPVSEKELRELVEKLYGQRPDVFNEAGLGNYEYFRENLEDM